MLAHWKLCNNIIRKSYPKCPCGDRMTPSRFPRKGFILEAHKRQIMFEHKEGQRASGNVSGGARHIISRDSRCFSTRCWVIFFLFVLQLFVILLRCATSHTKMVELTTLKLESQSCYFEPIVDTAFSLILPSHQEIISISSNPSLSVKLCNCANHP